MTQDSTLPGIQSVETQVEYIHCDSFPDLLEQLDISLLVLTYQAGKLMLIRSNNGHFNTLLKNFQQIKKIAVFFQRIAIGTLNQICFFTMFQKSLLS